MVSLGEQKEQEIFCLHSNTAVLSVASCIQWLHWLIQLRNGTGKEAQSTASMWRPVAIRCSPDKFPMVAGAGQAGPVLQAYIRGCPTRLTSPGEHTAKERLFTECTRQRYSLSLTSMVFAADSLLLSGNHLRTPAFCIEGTYHFCLSVIMENLRMTTNLTSGMLAGKGGNSPRCQSFITASSLSFLSSPWPVIFPPLPKVALHQQQVIVCC